MTQDRSRALPAFVASAVLAAAGAAASAMLVVDYLRPLPVFCSDEGGCEALKRTVFAAPFGIPLPLIGLAGFLALSAVVLVPGRLARRAQLTMASCAGLVGMTLLVLQLLLGQLCPYCCVVDASAVLSVAAAAWSLRRGGEAPLGVVAGSGVAMAVAAGAPLLLGFRADTTPQAIFDEMARTPRGEVTVVDFVDFECPYCRMTDAEFEPVLESHRDKIRLVRRQVPLSMHPHAMTAARAACCGEKLGQGDAMASALFTTEVEDLTPEGCEKIAERLGLPLDAFRACVTSPDTDASIAADKAEFKAARGHALPTIWIDQTPFIGARPQEAFSSALHEELSRAGS